MTVVLGVLVGAVLFGLFTWLRPGDRGCAGNCGACTRDNACHVTGDGQMEEMGGPTR